jgi:glycosyltransferase involved in cell wall biosynthesis
VNEPSIATVICAYTMERWGPLVESIRSVERQTRPAEQIIVAVDHNPELADRLRRELSQVTVVENDGARGLSGARNGGISVAHSDVVAFLDDDAFAEPDWLDWLAQGYAHERVAGVGGAIQPSWLNGRPDWFPEEFDWVVGCTYRGMPVSLEPIRNLIGANMSFRRELFDTVGTFRSGIGRVGTLPVGCEETELCIRVRQRFPEMTFLYEPRARVSHLVPPERATPRYFLQRCFSEGRSKTAVTRHVGSSDGLASERRYTVHTLPAGVVRGLTDTIRRGRPSGVARAAAIATGLAVTTAGFVESQLTSMRDERASRHKIRSQPIAPQ